MTRPTLHRAVSDGTLTATMWNENFDDTLDYVEDQEDAITSLSNTVAGITTPSSSFKATLLGLLYPVGSIYLTIDTSDTCPIATQLGGTWELVSTDRVLQGASTVAGAGGTKAAGLPNITGWISRCSRDGAGGAFAYTESGENGGDDHWAASVDFYASRSSSVYGNSSTVQPPAYLVNVWKRTA